MMMVTTTATISAMMCLVPSYGVSGVLESCIAVLCLVCGYIVFSYDLMWCSYVWYACQYDLLLSYVIYGLTYVIIYLFVCVCICVFVCVKMMFHARFYVLCVCA